MSDSFDPTIAIVDDFKYKIPCSSLDSIINAAKRELLSGNTMRAYDILNEYDQSIKSAIIVYNAIICYKDSLKEKREE